MSKKNKKSEKLNLSEFLGPEYSRALPSAPSARDPNAPPEDNFRGGRRPAFGEDSTQSGDTWRRGPRGGGAEEGGGEQPRRERGGGGRYGEDSQQQPSSKADEDTEWRKSRPASGRGGFEGGNAPPRSVADDASEWRRKPMGDRPTPPPSAADEATEWRRREPLRPDGPAFSGPRSEGPSAPSAADEATEWRRKQPIRQDGPPPSASPADESTEWRRREPLKTESPAPSNLSDADPNWRKSTRSSTEEPSSMAPRPSETDDWRSNKPQLPPKDDVPRRTPAEADTVDDWRAASKFKKTTTSTPKRKRDSLPTEAEVLTPFGKGLLLEERADGVRVVNLEFGAKAYLRGEDVIPSFGKEVMTPYGKGEFITHRFTDGITEVNLVSGGRAFLRVSELVESNNVKNSTRPSVNGNNKRNPSQGSSSGQRGRRYGDQERDRERENAFARGERRGRETPEGEDRPSRSEAFAAFSSGKKSSAPSVGTNEDREKAFSAFGGDKPPRSADNAGSSVPRLSREDKEKAFAPFSTGPRRGERGNTPDTGAAPSSNSSNGPPRAIATQSTPVPQAPFSAFDRSSGGANSRERAPFPGFSSNRDRGNDEPKFGNVGSFPGFGGERRERRSDASSKQSPAPGGEERYVGGMERLNATRGVPRVNDQGPSEPQAPPQQAVDIIAKTLPKGSKWGEDDDDTPQQGKATSAVASKKDAPPAAPAKKVTMEIALNTVRSVVKEYMIGEDKSTAISAMTKITTDDDKEFLSTFVASLSAQSFGGTKPRKLVSSLLIEMSKAGALPNEAIAEGLTRTLETHSAELPVLKEIFASVLEKTPTLSEAPLRGEGVKLLDGKQGSSETGSKNVDEFATDVFNAGAAGMDKMKEIGFSKLPGAGLALLRVVMKNAKLDDPSCVWIEKNAKTLAAVLYTAKKTEQMKAIEAIQIAFNELGFPKTSAGALIDKVFTQLYNRDILPDEAFMAWKEDLSSNTPGRDKAIIQTTNFFQALEEEDYVEDEEE